MKVQGISQKGKNRIREHGAIWKIVKELSEVCCLDNNPGILLESPDGYQRWIRISEDKDFNKLLSLNDHCE